jgi:hypothetical protein
VNNLDFALFELRGSPTASGSSSPESFNFFNHTQFDGVSTNFAAANFLAVTSARPARINQFGMKLIF